MSGNNTSNENGGPKFPIISGLLMIVFLVGGSVMMLFEWPAGPFNLDWGVLILCYLGYVYLIGATLFYAKTGK